MGFLKNYIFCIVRISILQIFVIAIRIAFDLKQSINRAYFGFYCYKSLALFKSLESFGALDFIDLCKSLRIAKIARFA